MDAGAALMLGGAAVLMVLPTAAMTVTYLLRRLESHERVKAIEHGHPPGFDAQETALRTRRSGVVCIAAGIGILAAVAVAAIFLGAGALACLGLALIPLFIGGGLIVDYRMQERRLGASEGR